MQHTVASAGLIKTMTHKPCLCNVAFPRIFVGYSTWHKKVEEDN